MSYIHHDLPKPGRFSLARVLAARKGHARRRAKAEQAHPMVQMQGRDAWPARENSPEMACYDTTQDDGEPLTWREAVRFWLVTATPAAVAGLGFWFLLWATKP